MFSGARLRKNVFYAGFAALILLAGLNMAASQTIHPLYYKLINGDRQAVVSYLTQIRPLPLFQRELLKYKNTWGVWVEQQVFQKEWERNRKIARFEEALKKNPKSRDVLFGLYQLYDERGDKDKSQEYLNKAREVDPSLK